MPEIYRHIVGVDEYIVQIDYNTNIQKIGKQVIHELLEDYKSVSKTK